MAVEMKSYVKTFVGGIVGVVITANLILPLLNATNQVATQVPLLAAPIVGTVVGAGVLLLIVDMFI